MRCLNIFVLVSLSLAAPFAHADDDGLNKPKIDLGVRAGGTASRTTQSTAPGSGAGGGAEIAVKYGEQDGYNLNSDPSFEAKASGQVTGSLKGRQLTGDLTARIRPWVPEQETGAGLSLVLESQSKATTGTAIVAATVVNGIGPQFDFSHGTLALIGQPGLRVQNRLTGNWEWAGGGSILLALQPNDQLRIEGRLQAGASFKGQDGKDAEMQFVIASLNGQYQLGEHGYLGAEVAAEHLHSKSLPTQDDTLTAVTAVATAGATF